MNNMHFVKEVIDCVRLISGHSAFPFRSRIRKQCPFNGISHEMKECKTTVTTDSTGTTTETTVTTDSTGTTTETTVTTDSTGTTTETTVTTGTTTEQQAPKDGDVNGDGEVTIADAVLLVRFVTEDGTLTAEQIRCIMDHKPDQNGDGQVTVMDVAVLLKALSES